MNRDEALQSMADTDWSAADVQREPRRMSFVYTVRLPDELAQWVEGKATEQNRRPSTLIRELLEAARRLEADDEPVVVRRSDLVRAIDAAVRPTAA
ncbi:hypothetical protein SAMN05444365_104318 [Micromonospora pattaloongensis]|uniref:Ribbon-helix-helix protein, copG family n=1 Tax=Micromonospora pattaloongensis TaxID=405436 RepID=A0A1H3P486_9ACTN|nr:hypothetical protein [Micromonospora pattaloongensis]SDY95922.1 hypothetical protein SAMN05444365_104318 [Micromonospora pattaloongensis]